jgi:ankyrin repeat protein
LRLFDCQKSPYINWLRFFSPGQPFEPPKNLQRGWIPPPLYTAALAGLTEICRLLLQSGADINEQGGRFGNALQASIFSGNTETVALLLENGADINRISGPYLTAMQAAVASSNVMVLDMLLDHGADINVVEVDLDKFFAVSGGFCPHSGSGTFRLPSGDMVIIKPLTFLTFTPPKKNATALQSAAFHGQLHMVERLVERGAKIDARAIIDGGGSYRSETERRFVHTAVELAASEGHTDIVGYLLRKGASLETSCLQLACRNGHFDTAKFLLEQGVNIDADGGGSTALQEAAGNGHMAIVCFLLEAGANVNSGESTTETGDSYRVAPALYRAAVSGREDMVELLLGKGAKIEFGQENDSRGSRDSALIGAATYGHGSIVNLLIAHGADINLSHYYKGSPLHMAAQHGHEAVCRILLNASADVDKLTSLYKTSALYWAVESNHTEIAQLLIQRGADVNTLTVSQDSQWNVEIASFSGE